MSPVELVADLMSVPLAELLRKEPQETPQTRGATEVVMGVAFSPDGKRIVTAYAEQSARRRIAH